jgi:hypothetical protein
MAGEDEAHAADDFFFLVNIISFFEVFDIAAGGEEDFPDAAFVHVSEKGKSFIVPTLHSILLCEMKISDFVFHIISGFCCTCNDTALHYIV